MYYISAGLYLIALISEYLKVSLIKSGVSSGEDNACFINGLSASGGITEGLD